MLSVMTKGLHTARDLTVITVILCAIASAGGAASLAVALTAILVVAAASSGKRRVRRALKGPAKRRKPAQRANSRPAAKRSASNGRRPERSNAKAKQTRTRA